MNSKTIVLGQASEPGDAVHNKHPKHDSRGRYSTIKKVFPQPKKVMDKPVQPQALSRLGLLQRALLNAVGEITPRYRCAKRT